MKKGITMDRILIGLSFIIAVTALTMIWKSDRMNESVVFVDISKLVDNYKLKKDLERSSSSDLNRIKGVVDSLTMIKKMSGISAGPTHTDSALANAQYAFNRYYQLTNQEISKKVWERLNPVLEAYGKDKKLGLIIGATGAGTVLYGSKGKDITDDVIIYVNQQYEKGS